MTASPNYTYDVFISYSPADRKWVQGELLVRLEQAGLKVIIDHRDFALGLPQLVNIEEAVQQSRKILLVLSPNATESKWAHFEALLAQTADPAGQDPRMLPLLLEPCPLPARLAMLTIADFTNVAARDKQMVRLLRALGGKHRVYISYGHGIEPDESLAKQLAISLTKARHNVFIDPMMQVGVDWATEIQRQIDASDFVIVLLSALSSQNEMVTKEVEHAYRLFQRNSRPQLLPVRVNYGDPLPYQLSTYLNQLNFAEWRGKRDTRRLIVRLCDVIGHGENLASSQQPIAERRQPAEVAPPSAHADPRDIERADVEFVDSLDDPTGTVRLDSTFYIEREADERLRRELSKPRGATITIRAPRQTGKSSLLIRGVAQAQKQGGRVVFLDLQSIDELFLQNRDAFLRYFSDFLIAKLGLDSRRAQRTWEGSFGSSDKLTNLMEDYVLPQINTKVVLAIDEADRLLSTPFRDGFFGLLRSWHNQRALQPIWQKLDLLLVIATEPNVLIKDLNQSPFNVGLRIDLEDFTEQQVAELNQRYRAPLHGQDLAALVDLLNGHPYLTSRALYTLLSEHMSWVQLRRVANSERGPFGDHLRRYVWLLHDQPQLRAALRQVLDHQRCPDELSFYQLIQAGLLKGMDYRACQLRCRLYEEYLKDKL
jgi:hypothetical protein